MPNLSPLPLGHNTSSEVELMETMVNGLALRLVVSHNTSSEVELMETTTITVTYNLNNVTTLLRKWN